MRKVYSECKQCKIGPCRIHAENGWYEIADGMLNHELPTCCPYGMDEQGEALPRWKLVVADVQCFGGILDQACQFFYENEGKVDPEIDQIVTCDRLSPRRREVWEAALPAMRELELFEQEHYYPPTKTEINKSLARITKYDLLISSMWLGTVEGLYLAEYRRLTGRPIIPGEIE